MKTPADIKKGFKHCSEEGCKGCPYEDDCHLSDGGSELAADGLVYVRQLERERDAAIHDLKVISIECRSEDVCFACKKRNEPCEVCDFEWRGPQEKQPPRDV